MGDILRPDIEDAMGGGEVIQVKALLGDGPLPPRAALQIIIALCDAAALEGALVPGGRPLSAGVVLLDLDGTARLQEVGEVDSLSIGVLLAQLLLGQAALPPSQDALLTALDLTLQQPEIDRDQRQALLSLVRACHSPTPEGRPPLHRVQRRCLDLLPHATGTPLAALLKRRHAPSTSWMDLPDAAAGEAGAGLTHLLTPPPAAAPAAAPPSAPGARPLTTPPLQRDAAARPAPARPMPVALLTGLGVVAILLLGAGGFYVAQQQTSSGRRGEPIPPDHGDLPLRAAETLERYSGPAERTLTLLSLPAGAEVAVDGVTLGTTPLESLTVDTGVHNIRMKLSDKVVFEQTIMVDRSARCTWEPEVQEGESWRCEPL